jgi:rubrerythrin
MKMYEYISKQRAKDLMGCCLASAKANYKEETDVFKRAKFQCYVETIEAMIDVVGAVEAADVQPVKRGKWNIKDNRFHSNIIMNYAECSCCGHTCSTTESEHNNFCPNCGADMRGDTD